MKTFIFLSIGYDKSTLIINAETKEEALAILTEKDYPENYEQVYELDNERGVRFDSSDGVHVEPALKSEWLN
nr:hypothetical protein 26 [Balneolaceae bacterium]